MGLRDVRVTIPTAVKRGDNALLICNYDMEGDSLYSIKWYKGKREFYRYTPKETSSIIKTFPVAGINVEVKRNINNNNDDNNLVVSVFSLSRRLIYRMHRRSL